MYAGITRRCLLYASNINESCQPDIPLQKNSDALHRVLRTRDWQPKLVLQTPETPRQHCIAAKPAKYLCAPERRQFKDRRILGCESHVSRKIKLVRVGQLLMEVAIDCEALKAWFTGRQA